MLYRANRKNGPQLDRPVVLDKARKYLLLIRPLRHLSPLESLVTQPECQSIARIATVGAALRRHSR